MNSTYEPPYDSPIEETVAWNIVKYLADSVVVDKQVEYHTIGGLFRVDFLLQKGSRKVGLECDGREFHDLDRDQWRDAMLIGSKQLHAIYHFPGAGIFNHVAGCIAALSIWEPGMFSSRGRVNLETLAREVFQDDQNQRDRAVFVPQPSFDPPVEFPDWNDDIAPRTQAGFYIWRTSPDSRSTLWLDLFKYAESKGGGDLDSLMAQWAQEFGSTER